jgi:hypothetical protein
MGRCRRALQLSSMLLSLGVKGAAGKKEAGCATGASEGDKIAYRRKKRERSGSRRRRTRE